VIRIELTDPIDIGAEAFRWEVAIAIAGAVLGIDPFDQPNVEEAKQLTRKLLEHGGRDAANGSGEASGASQPVASGDGLTLFGDAALRLTHGDGSIVGELARHLARRKANAYLCLQAFIAPSPERDAAIARIRTLLRDRTGRATDRRLRTPVPPLDRPAAQGRRADRLVHPAHVGPPGRRRDPRLAVHLRGAHRRPGGRRLRRDRVARPADPAGPSRRRPGRRTRRPRTGAHRRSRQHGGLTAMRIGFIGLGRMGANMVRRLVRDGHEIVIYNRTPEKTRELEAEGEGAHATFSIAELVAALEKPRSVWVMVPAGDATEAQIAELLEHLEPGDTIIDGGNTNFHDDVRRHEDLAKKGIRYVDAGTSGGIWGLQVGYCLMVGGDKEAVDPLGPILTSLAPKGGFLHVGGPGAGHYVKMVHNGIEYGLMQAYAEGFEIMHASEYDLDLAAISDLWMQGSVVRSWLLELLGRAYRAQGQDLEHLKGYVEDSGEGRWTVQDAIDHDVPAPVITLSLLTRFRSRQEDSYGAKVLAALRNEFGGHAVKTE
jgi:6-phosphogluconate dehydrogenase